jgi:two-component system cell cycle sensor histidine kinase/response regulator CckA
MGHDLRHRYGQSLFESSPAAMAVLNAEGVFEDANTALSDLFGFPLDAIIGVKFGALLHPQEAEGAERWFRRFVRSDERSYEVHRRFVRGDGRELLLRVRVGAMRDRPDGPFAVVAFDDVTAEGRLVAQVGRHEERFQSLIEEATDLITIISAEGKVMYESPSVERLMGYPPAEPNGGDAFERIHPDDVSRCRRAFQRMLVDGAPVHVDLRVRHADGHWVELDTIARNMLDDPAVGGIVVNSRDVSESQRAERELRRTERSYRTFVEQLPVVTYVAQLEYPHRVTYISPQAEELLGYPVSEWLEDPQIWSRVVHPDDYRANASQGAALADGGKDRLRLEYRLVAREGDTVWVIDDIVMLRDEDGTPIAYQGLLVNVSDRVQLEEQLRHSQRLEAIGRLAGGIAHDFNNLLLAISGYSDFALDRAIDNLPLRGNIEQIKLAAERATSLTQQLLAFGRQQVLQNETICVASTIEAVAKLLRPLIGEHIQLNVELDPTAGCIEGDRTQLEQVLLNLALNARDAMAEGGTLTIHAKGIDLTEAAATSTDVAPGQYTVISVIDTGTGMTDATCARIFDPFYTTKPKGQGTGLGLATAYGIVKQSGGEIRVDSVAGSGTRFDVLLPASDREPTAVSPVVAGPASARGETILLVEDDDVVRMLVASMLSAQGYRVIAETDAEQAVAIAASEHCELLLTDVVMPNTGGAALADDVIHASPMTKVLFMSGYAENAIRDDLLHRPNIAFLQKPFSSSELAHAIDQLLRRHRRESPTDHRTSPRDVWEQWSTAA